MPPQTTEQLEENLERMIQWCKAEASITSLDHVYTMLSLINGQSRSIINDLQSGVAPSPVALKIRLRIMYSLIVKLEMWRQVQFNDYDKIHLFKNKRGQRVS